MKHKQAWLKAFFDAVSLVAELINVCALFFSLFPVHLALVFQPAAAPVIHLAYLLLQFLSALARVGFAPAVLKRRINSIHNDHTTIR